MATARSAHTATLLWSGKVLVAGGVGLITYLASAELYSEPPGCDTSGGNGKRRVQPVV